MITELSVGTNSVVVTEGDLVLSIVNYGKQGHNLFITGSITEHPRAGRMYHNHGFFAVSHQRPAYRLLEPREFKGFTRALVTFSSPSLSSYHPTGEVYKGKKDIMDYLTKKGWKEHAEWIGQLEDPVRRLPKATRQDSVYYIGRKIK